MVNTVSWASTVSTVSTVDTVGTVGTASAKIITARGEPFKNPAKWDARLYSDSSSYLTCGSCVCPQRVSLFLMTIENYDLGVRYTLLH